MIGPMAKVRRPASAGWSYWSSYNKTSDTTSAGGKGINSKLPRAQPRFERERPLSGVGNRESFLFTFRRGSVAGVGGSTS